MQRPDILSLRCVLDRACNSLCLDVRIYCSTTITSTFSLHSLSGLPIATKAGFRNNNGFATAPAYHQLNDTAPNTSLEMEAKLLCLSKNGLSVIGRRAIWRITNGDGVTLASGEIPPSPTFLSTATSDQNAAIDSIRLGPQPFSKEPDWISWCVRGNCNVKLYAD